MTTHIVAAGHCVQVAFDLTRSAYVGQEKLEQLLITLTVPKELGDRYEKTLLVDFARLGGQDAPADVHHVAGVREVGDDPTVAEDGRDQRDVVDLSGRHP